MCDSFFSTPISKVSERDRENGAKSIQDYHHKNQVKRERMRHEREFMLTYSNVCVVYVVWLHA